MKDNEKPDSVDGSGSSACYPTIVGVVMEFGDIVGKTIQAATHVKRPTNDNDGWLLLEFTDGSRCIVYSWYEKTDGFMPVDPSA